MGHQMRPKCYGCDQKAAPGHMFCTTRCAASYSEGLVRGNEEHWCPLCERWSSFSHVDDIGNRLLLCDHIETGITEGMSRADAVKAYDKALVISRQNSAAYDERRRTGSRRA